MASRAGASAARELLRLRLQSQLIAQPRSAGTSPTIADVARHLLALQAQDFGQAVWALGLRAPGSTKADVAAALDSAQVVRSWPMRGTLHFTTPEDLRWMLSLTAQRTVTGVAARHRQLDLDAEVFGRARDIAVGALSGGGSCSRDEFFALLAAAGIETTGQRGVHIIWRLSLDGLICWGPTRGTQQALVLLDEWAPATRETLSRDEALGEFVLRYFTGHGPATLKDFCWWSKTSVADANRALERARDRLSEIVIGDTAYWMTSETDAAARPRARAGTHALPGFDEYLLGYQNRSPALPDEFADRIVPGNNGMFLPTIVSAGEIVGTWRRLTTTKGVTVTIDPFTSLTTAERTGFEREMRRYGSFLGLPATITDAGRVAGGRASASATAPAAARAAPATRRSR